jgi:hypothetical protein
MIPDSKMLTDCVASDSSDLVSLKQPVVLVSVQSRKRLLEEKRLQFRQQCEVEQKGMLECKVYESIEKKEFIDLNCDGEQQDAIGIEV